MPTLNHPLMENNITRADLDAVIEFLRGDPILTNSRKCREFEERWSEWLGVKHSVFVNSGASANYLTMALLAEEYGVGEVIVPPLTWISDIASVVRAGFTPIFVDINPRTLCLDEELVLAAVTPRTKAVFLTHVLGFNGLSSKLLGELKARNVMLVEDVSEAHGATFSGKKLGTFGEISNFSFYFAHHMSTIEGGMVCTDNERLYQIARMFRSHGMTREVTNETLRASFEQDATDLRPEFIFAYPGFNFRSTEINAVIGLSQLPRLDAHNAIRRRNFEFFLRHLDSRLYFTDFELQGSCNYAFTLVLQDADTARCERLIALLQRAGVEFRRGTAGGGNQLRQPYLKKIIAAPDYAKFPVVDHLHFFGFYIGNYPTLSQERIANLCSLLNSLE